MDGSMYEAKAGDGGATIVLVAIPPRTASADCFMADRRSKILLLFDALMLKLNPFAVINEVVVATRTMKVL